MNKIIKIILFVIVLLTIFTSYTLLAMIYLGEYSESLQKKFEEKELINKNLDYTIEVLGQPNKIDYDIDYIIDKNGVKSNFHLYIKLTYYTNHPLINFIGFFPCGGTKILADSTGRVIRFREWCY